MLSSSRPPRLRALFTALVVTLGLLGFSAPAAEAVPVETSTWDGGGTTNNWTDAENWMADTFRINYSRSAVTLTSVTLTASTTTVTASPTPSKPGEEVTLTASVTPSTATGTVRFFDTDGTTLLGMAAVSGGAAVLKTSALAATLHMITARYLGEGAVASSTSAPTTHVVDGAAPDTAITSGPVAGSTGNPATATFEFDSSDTDVASFECSVDRGAYAACVSPQAFTGLTGGSHTFAVRAIDTAGNVDATPATRTWTVAGIFTVTGGVTVGGVAKVGQTLTAVSDVVTAPEATSVTGRWFRGQTAITGATGTTYTLTNDDVSAKLTYRQTHTRADYDTRVITADPTVTITGGDITLAVPTVSGDPVVGEVLTATPGAATPSTATVTLTWNVGGVSTGVTGTTYAVAPADLGKKVSVTAAATQTDYDTTYKTSDDTATITSAAFTTGPTAVISGVFKVGEVLTANEGTAVPAASGYTYQWFAGDTAITGATDRTLTLGKDHKGQQVSVTVTATRTGYAPASDTSDRSVVVVVTNQAPDLNLTRSGDVRLGQSATLTWNSSDATSVTASGSWAGTKGKSGTETVTPAATETQTYTLTATNGSGTTTAQVVVNVAPPATKLALKARGLVKSGRKITIKATGLAPVEAYTVRIGGVEVGTGRASASGKVKRAVRVPAAVGVGKRLVRVTGSLGDRTGTRHVKVAQRISRR